jgi:hypothetical protein
MKMMKYLIGNMNIVEFITCVVIIAGVLHHW